MGQWKKAMATSGRVCYEGHNSDAINEFRNRMSRYRSATISLLLDTLCMRCLWETICRCPVEAGKGGLESQERWG